MIKVEKQLNAKETIIKNIKKSLINVSQVEVLRNHIKIVKYFLSEIKNTLRITVKWTQKIKTKAVSFILVKES